MEEISYKTFPDLSNWFKLKSVLNSKMFIAAHFTVLMIYSRNELIKLETMSPCLLFQLTFGTNYSLLMFINAKGCYKCVFVVVRNDTKRHISYCFWCHTTFELLLSKSFFFFLLKFFLFDDQNKIIKTPLASLIPIDIFRKGYGMTPYV